TRETCRRLFRREYGQNSNLNQNGQQWYTLSTFNFQYSTLNYFLLVLTDFVGSAPEGRNVYSCEEINRPSSVRSDICGRRMSPRWGWGTITTTKSVSIRFFEKQKIVES